MGAFAKFFLNSHRFWYFLTKNMKKRWYIAIIKKRYNFLKLSRYYIEFSLIFCLKSHFLSFFGTKSAQKKTIYLSLKNVTICENSWTVILSFCWKSVWKLTFWVGKKHIKRGRCAYHKKYVTICINSRTIVKATCWIYVWNLTFLDLFEQKTHKHRLCT